MAVEISAFGNYSDGREILLYTFSNRNGMKVSVTNIGAALVKVLVPDGAGGMTDVVLGFERGEQYLENPSFMGVVIGPCANRTGNAVFSIDGKTYRLDANDGKNNLHSHKELGYHKRLWQAECGENSVTFSLRDEDGDMGFPGNKSVSVTYSLSEANELKLHYHGTSDKKAVLNLTNHTYFNLEGQSGGSIEEHELWLAAHNYTPADSGSIPTGEIVPVQGTPMDFTEPKMVGRDIGEDFAQLKYAGGYDHNWVIDGWDGSLRHIATLYSPACGRKLKAYTTLPGVQFYAGNFIDRQKGKEGTVYGPRMGMCLETQYYPDSVNKPEFPSDIFGAGREYDSETVYEFEF